jgi:hypothetical protein
MMPSQPRARFILIHAHFSLPFFQARLDGPTQAADAHEFLQGTGERGIAQKKLDFGLRGQGPTKDGPTPLTGQFIADGRHTHTGKFGDQSALATFFDHVTLPLRGGHLRHQLAHFIRRWGRALDAWVCPRASQEPAPWRLDRRRAPPHPCVCSPFREVPLAECRDSIQKCWDFSIFGITRDPSKRNHGAFDQSRNHVQTQLRFSLKRQRLWNPTRCPTITIVSGKPLGQNIQAFTADMYKDAESEFDAVLLSSEGRFLGEAEGKDHSPVNIDKLSQLERNLQEDYARDDVSEYAKGILFGNAYRLTKPQERTEFFTAKCLSGSHRSKIALVRTPDLFAIAKYLKEHDDPAFASECRKAIKQTEGGVVQFPQLPVEEEHSIMDISSNGQQQG